MRLKFIFLSLLSFVVSHAQDFHFSQITETPILLNPAATGFFQGWERFQVNHRNQWLGASTQFSTSSFVGDLNLLKNRQGDNAHLGVGAQLYNDVGGDSKFGLQSASVSVSGILPISAGHKISAGIQSGFTSRKIDLSRVHFENQWDGQKFDPNIGSGEPGGFTNFRHFDASAGLLYQYDGGATTFQRREETIFKFGVSVFHLNKPQLKYTETFESYLYRKLVIHSSFSKDLVNSTWSFDVSAIQFFQGPHHETIFGGTLRNRMQNGTKITGYYQDAFFGFGLYTRWKDAIIPKIFLDFNGLKFGVSYDVTISALQRAQYGGSLEFSLSYTNKNSAIFKTGKRR